MNLKKILLFTFLSVPLFSQNLIGLNVNNDELELESSLNLNKYMDSDTSSAYIANLSYLHGVDKDLLTLGVGVYQTYSEVDGLLFGFGMNTVVEKDFVALPLYAHAIYVLPFIKYIPKTNISAKFLYAPEILTFVDGESYIEMRTEIDFDIINDVSVYGGYRAITSTYKFDDDLDITDNFYGGFRYSF